MMLTAVQAQAQDAATGPTSEAATPVTDEIVVTANKRAENVQQVPLAVSVLAPSAMAASGVRQFTDLGRLAPSLTVRPAEQPANSNISLRGVGTFAFGIGVESSVAVLVDEVPLAFQARAFTDLPDVDHIEVLRGPQSTLYGKSASAGLINIITRNPTHDFQLRANALATTDSEYGGNFSASGPISDTLGYVFSASYSKWDGNVTNLYNNKKVNGREAVTSRAKIRWEPKDDVAITFAGNYLNGNTTVGRPFIAMGSGALLRNQAGLSPNVTMPGVVFTPSNQNISNNYDSRTKYEGYGAYLRAEIGLGKMQVVSISSYDHFKQDDYLDQDDTSAPGGYGNNNQVGQFRSNLYTQEIRLLSPTEDAFHYTLGAYYGNVIFNRPFVRGPQFSPANWYATFKGEQVAAFAQFDWEFLPKATLTAGGRVQNERVSYTFRDFRITPSALNPGYWSNRASDTAGTYKISGRYEFTPDLMAFVTYSTGYKGQTYDLTTGFDQNRANAGPIRPEKSTDWEAGIRTQFFDRKLTMNVTVFNTNYKDLQAQSIETLSDGTQNYRLTNVGKLRTRGVEVDMMARPITDVTLSGSVAYLDAKYKDYPVAQCYPLQTPAQGCVTNVTPNYQNLTGQRAVQAPEWKFSVTGEYAPLLTDNLRAVLQGNWQYQSSTYYVAEDPQTFQKAYHIVNLGLGLRADDKKWEIVGFVNNVFDQQYFPSLVNTAGNFNNPATGLSTVATQALLPRDFRRYGGVRIGVNF
jgi:iron complex outermembrane receptor protein